MDAEIGVKQKLLVKVAFDLSKILADEFVLYTKTKNAHWNVEGPDFYSVHKFFESNYEFLDEAMDEIAERIRSVGHYSPASLKQFLKLTMFSEGQHKTNDSRTFTKDLLADHEAMIIRLRERIDVFVNDYNDAGSSDFLTALMEKHEKIAWMLRASLK